MPAAEGTAGNMAYSTSSLPLSDLLGTEVAPIDLASALSMAGVQNPEMLIARQRVVEAVAERQLAAATLLPSLRAGLSYDDHTGPLQQSFGNILSLHRSALYVGAGAYAIAAGSVNIPGVFWENNWSQWIINNLQAMTTIEQQQFHSRAVENQVLLRVAVGYNNLLRTVGMRAVLAAKPGRRPRSRAADGRLRPSGRGQAGRRRSCKGNRPDVCRPIAERRRASC